ncbi:ATP-binding protein [Streptomyces sp. NPDC059176]|uniref:ATP-binding protein n=1 Tax=unclassified Streptomyces TaxID=2593676 RepID=UPI003687A0E5
MSTISTTAAGRGSRASTTECGAKPSSGGQRAARQADELGELFGLGGFAACGLDGRPENADQARRFVALTLNDWALEDLVSDMAAIAGELVANAVHHALTPEASGDLAEYPLWLGLFRHPESLVCSVADPSPEPPRLPAAGGPEPAGRGLGLIDELSDDWSWSLTPPRGKTVWASLPLPVHAA